MGTHYASMALADMNEPSQPFQASRDGPKSLGSQYFSTPHPMSGHDYQPESSFKIQLWPVFGPVGPCPHCPGHGSSPVAVAGGAQREGLPRTAKGMPQGEDKEAFSGFILLYLGTSIPSPDPTSNPGS